MNRRKFIVTSIGAGALAIGGAGIWFQQLENEKDLSIDTLLIRLTELQKQTYTFVGEWKAYKTFIHLAQSIEYSMSGYPKHKSDLFKSIVGKSAFAVFSKKGSMSHGLNEPIPGAPPIQDSGDNDLALQHLTQTLEDFNHHKGKLKPHFAYGELTHAEYAFAHTMHVYNHFKELLVA